jgi:hypothetical protein
MMDINNEISGKSWRYSGYLLIISARYSIGNLQAKERRIDVLAAFSKHVFYVIYGSGCLL